MGNGSDGDDPARRGSTDLLTRTKPKPKKPSLYQVMILNDDYTPMEFVIYVLEKFFGKNREEATQIMLHIHTNGKGRCGVYSFEIAETKVMQVMRTAEQEHHPLQCTMEKV
ncbi:MAG: ATP-dependent Clp protease adapter ClpS [Pseudomonadota bacterium]